MKERYLHVQKNGPSVDENEDNMSLTAAKLGLTYLDNVPKLQKGVAAWTLFNVSLSRNVETQGQTGPDKEPKITENVWQNELK